MTHLHVMNCNTSGDNKFNNNINNDKNCCTDCQTTVYLVACRIILQRCKWIYDTPSAYRISTENGERSVLNSIDISSMAVQTS